MPDTTIANEKLSVVCTGITPLMFDRYQGIDGEVAPEDKLYLSRDGKGHVVIPSKNLESFLGSDDQRKSCAGLFMGKKRGPYVQACGYAITVEPWEIPITRNGKPIVFKGWDAKSDPPSSKSAGIHVDYDKGVVPGKGVPVELKRPLIELPWKITFDVTLWKNDLIDRKRLTDWLTNGGIQVAIGNHRPKFGRFAAAVA